MTRLSDLPEVRHLCGAAVSLFRKAEVLTAAIAGRTGKGYRVARTDAGTDLPRMPGLDRALMWPEPFGHAPEVKFLSAPDDVVPDWTAARLLAVFETCALSAARAGRQAIAALDALCFRSRQRLFPDPRLAARVHGADPKLEFPRLGRGLPRWNERESAHADRRT